MDDELNIGELENETVFIPDETHHDEEDSANMKMGKGLNNDLRDPWFHTSEGSNWLKEQGED